MRKGASHHVTGALSASRSQDFRFHSSIQSTICRTPKRNYRDCQYWKSITLFLSLEIINVCRRPTMLSRSWVVAAATLALMTVLTSVFVFRAMLAASSIAKSTLQVLRNPLDMGTHMNANDWTGRSFFCITILESTLPCFIHSAPSSPSSSFSWAQFTMHLPWFASIWLPGRPVGCH